MDDIKPVSIIPGFPIARKHAFTCTLSSGTQSTVRGMNQPARGPTFPDRNTGTVHDFRSKRELGVVGVTRDREQNGNGIPYLGDSFT